MHLEVTVMKHIREIRLDNLRHTGSVYTVWNGTYRVADGKAFAFDLALSRPGSRRPRLHKLWRFSLNLGELFDPFYSDLNEPVSTSSLILIVVYESHH